MKTLLKMKLQRKMLVEQQRARAQKGKIDSQASQTSAAHAGIVMDLSVCVCVGLYCWGDSPLRVCVCACACARVRECACACVRSCMKYKVS